MCSSSPGRLMVWSPRKRRLAILRRYQALGKARISLSLRMSYLKEAEPMSHTAEGEKNHICFDPRSTHRASVLLGERSLKNKSTGGGGQIGEVHSSSSTLLCLISMLVKSPISNVMESTLYILFKWSLREKIFSRERLTEEHVPYQAETITDRTRTGSHLLHV